MAFFETVDVGRLVGWALAIIAPTFGAVVWRRHEATWLEIASWTIPVFVLLAGGLVIGSPPLSWLLTWLGAGLFVAMMLSERADRWWRRTVLRSRR